MGTVFEQTFFASFDDGDPGGIVFFGNYYKIAHRLLESFIIDSGISWQQWFANSDLIVPLVHSQADYLQPLFAGNNYVGRVQVERAGNSSISFAYEFLSEDKESVCAKLRTVHVFVDKKSMQSTKAPDFILSALS